MFQWLIGLTARYRLKQRCLFLFHDGQRRRYADPFLLWRRLQTHETLHMESMGPAVDTGQEPETTIVVESLCEIFGVTRFDDASKRGLTDWEVLDLLADLEEYFAALKKNINPGPISPVATDSTSSKSPDPLVKTTSCCSASMQMPSE